MSGLRAKDQRRFTFVDCEKCMKLCQSGVPAAKGHRRTVPPSISAVSRTWWFQIEWTLPIFTLGEERITDAFVLDRLRDFGNRHGRDLLCPHFEFPRLLQCFDPRICSCLGADLRIGVSSSMASSRPGLVGEPIPTCNEASKLTPGDPFIPASWDDSMEQHSVSCEYCTAVYCWARDGSVVFLQRSSPATYDTNKTSCMAPRELRVVSSIRWWCGGKDDSVLMFGSLLLSISHGVFQLPWRRTRMIRRLLLIGYEGLNKHPRFVLHGPLR